ncbi:MAG: GNAT family N-acetyltransferase [Streptosporangiales bacterium]|nr:GNAT family N-acetyltransferase [Streptosporangiales bacterium]
MDRALRVPPHRSRGRVDDRDRHRIPRHARQVRRRRRRAGPAGTAAADRRTPTPHPRRHIRDRRGDTPGEERQVTNGTNGTRGRADATLRIHALRDQERRSADPALVALVQLIQEQPPYSYRADEVPHASTWFTALLSNSTVAYTASTDRPVAYCVLMPLRRRPDGEKLATLTGVDLERTLYIAELGADPSIRRRGVATRLLLAGLSSAPPDVDTYLVRTLADNTPAITLYQNLGFTLIDRTRQTHRGRSRVFLTCDRPAHGWSSSNGGPASNGR